MVEIDGEHVDDTELVRALGDKYNAEILSVTHEPRSAKELNEEHDIPIATGYRRIEDLSEIGLLGFEKSVLTEESRRRDTYRRQVDRVSIEFHEDDFSVTIEEPTLVENKIDDMWRAISDTDSGRASAGF